jgi:hypothetical protein
MHPPWKRELLYKNVLRTAPAALNLETSHLTLLTPHLDVTSFHLPLPSLVEFGRPGDRERKEAVAHMPPHPAEEGSRKLERGADGEDENKYISTQPGNTKAAQGLPGTPFFSMGRDDSS